MHGPTCFFWANLTPFSLQVKWWQLRVLAVGFLIGAFRAVQRRLERVKAAALGLNCSKLLQGGLIIMALLPTGYFGPFSARIRGLFVKHTRTGNPLVDSVRCAFVCAHFV
jgi:hypothetical protein